MFVESSRTHEAAQILAERRRQGLAGPCLPEGLRPTSLGEALAIQAAVSALIGDVVAGWKCGTPGPDKLVVAPIYAGTVQQGPLCLAWAHEGQVKVEPELAFVLGQALPARALPYATHEVDAAISATHLALELIDSRYLPQAQAQASFADKLADGLVNQGLYLGPRVDDAQAQACQAMSIGIDIGGRRERELAGQHPDGWPRTPLYWLVEHLRATGVGLAAGQVVITGSYAGSFGLPVGPVLGLQFGELGQLHTTLAARPRGAEFTPASSQ